MINSRIITTAIFNVDMLKHCFFMQVTLSRFDLFHGHLFRARDWPHSLGILFHAMEYPAYGEEFDVILGFCQLHSHIRFQQGLWDSRNWIFSQVCCMSTISRF